MEIRELTLSEWKTALPDRGFEVFHLPEALEVVDRHESGTLRLLGGYRGEQVVGLLPVFVRRMWNVAAILSPPPGMFIGRLGPITMSNSPKQGKREQLNRTFVAEALGHLGVSDPLTVSGFSCGQFYDDPRPFVWEGFDVRTRFSYMVSLANGPPEELRSSFSRSLKREIREAEDLEVSVEVRGLEAAHDVYRATRQRYDEQDKSLPISWEFTRELVQALDRHARVYMVEDGDGDAISGVIVLYSNDLAHFWLGGTRGEYRDLSVNSLLHWRIIKDAVTDDSLPPVKWYDLGNANDERLSRYKSKFNPTLVPHYTVESGRLASLTKRIYAWFSS